NPIFGFITGWIYVGASLCGPAAIVAVFAQYLREGFGVPMAIGIIVCIVISIIVAYMAIGFGVNTLLALWVVQVVLLLIPGIYLLNYAASQGIDLAQQFVAMNTPAGTTLGLAALGYGTFVWFFGYPGFEFPTVLVEEAKEGWKTVEYGAIISAVGLGLTYWILTNLWMSPVTFEMIDKLSASSAPLLILSGLLGFGWTDIAVSLGTILSCLGITCGFLLAVARILYDMGRTGVLPKGFSKTNKYGSPWVAVTIVGLIWLVNATIAGFMSATYFEILIDVLVFGSLWAYIWAMIACMKTHWSDWSARGIIVDKVLPLIGLVVSGYMFVTQSMLSWISGIAWAVVGCIVTLVIYYVRGKEVFHKAKY
ncbi:MAG: APC family permease, partial [Candidatus Kryptoniota bacterium]